MKLLNIDVNAKTVKGRKLGYATAVLYLAPVDLSGFQVCPMASPGCAAACLNTAGRGMFDNVQSSRIRKTRFFFERRADFMDQLVKEVERHVKKARAEGLIPVVRLNGTSDIPWERMPVRGCCNIMARFPDVQFYDYTKIRKRAIASVRPGDFWPRNYHITFSRSETNHFECLEVLAAGGNVAVVYRDIPDDAVHPVTMAPLSASERAAYNLEAGTAWPVVDGDVSDARFADGLDGMRPQGFATKAHRGVVVALKAKGRAKKDRSGFVVA